MRRTNVSRIVLAVALAAMTPAAFAQTKAAAPSVAIEQGAIDALKSMGAYLRSLKAFQVDAVTTDEEVLDDGQKVQTEGKARILAQMPGRLWAEVSNDRHERQYVYDGKTFTLFAKRVNFYATVPAPPTVGQLADKLDESFGMSVPLEDLFRWGDAKWTAEGITGAIDLGPSPAAGATCQQYAFRQADIDWQVWIQLGDFPLPRKLVITTKTDEARPQHTAVFNWNLAPSFNDASFAFNPPAGAGKVVLAELKPATGAKK
jgi:hypothetical protein